MDHSTPDPVPMLPAVAFILAAAVGAAAPAALPQQHVPAPGTPAVRPTAKDSAWIDSVAAARLARMKKRSIRVGAGADSARAALDRGNAQEPPRIAVTPQLIASAYADERARSIVLGARAARLTVDSSLRGYDAKAYQRLSIGLGLRIAGRERLFLRYESAQHIVWDRDRGALVTVTGARWGMPVIDKFDGAAPDIDDDGLLELPYTPGRDRLWPLGTIKEEANERSIIHPIAAGAEAYYRYEAGDSMSVRLPSGREFRLLELRVRPRAERWNTVVGSLWFDRESSQLVRAAYRLSAPLDVWLIEREEAKREGKKSNQDDVPFWLRPALNPMRATVSAVTQEFSLQDQRWWLPVNQQASGLVELGAMRIPIEIEGRFTYASVTTTPSPVALEQVLARHLADSLATDSLEQVRKTLGDSAYDAARDARTKQRYVERLTCDRTQQGILTAKRVEGGTKMLVVVPCDTTALVNSRDLPTSLYTSSDELFGESEADELKAYALQFKAQADGGRTQPTFQYGIGGGLTRYNRVEGLSLGILAEQGLGSGYSVRAVGRLATANLHPGGELSLARTDGRRALGVNAYHRLETASDYGRPFGLGASLGALLWGRDDGFYFRTTGIEATRETLDGRGIRWRLFAEHQGDAAVATQASFANLVGDTRFRPNITARRGEVGGIGARLTRTVGLDPHGWRLFADAKAEAAGGTFDYARGLMDVTLSHGLGPWLDGALTGAAGTTAGAAPVQRLFFVGGAESVRGQRAGERVGNAFWIGRAEIGSSFVGARPVVFGDLGWAGDRRNWQHPGRPIAGAGVGASFLDGLLRIDVAKGLRPTRGVRADLYVEARF